jgi:hypothetical protein
MSGFSVIKLSDLKDTAGAELTHSLLSTFSCPGNEDIETFLKKSALTLSDQNIANTYLVFCHNDTDNPVFVGYFALAYKVLLVDDSIQLSSKWRKAFEKFGVHEKEMRHYLLSVPLIGQLGKNYANGNNKYISGEELLLLATNRVAAAQSMISGKIVYLECADHPTLIAFYTANGFFRLNNRYYTNGDTNEEGYLVQLIKYL